MEADNREKPRGEMSEKNIFAVANIFWESEDWVTQFRFRHDPNNKRKFFQVDCYSAFHNIVLEYDGPDHYNNVWKVRKDNQRRQYFKENAIKFQSWPYFCQLTRDMAKWFFGEAYTEEKYLTAIGLVYGVNEESSILSPGFGTTEQTPANFVANGERRFLEELELFPISVKHQIVHTIKLYIRDFGDQYLVITESAEMAQLLEMEPRSEYLDLFFDRQ